MEVRGGLLHFTFLPAQVFYPPCHRIGIWDTGGWDPSGRSSRSNPSDFQAESDAPRHARRARCRRGSSSGHTQPLRARGSSRMAQQCPWRQAQAGVQWPGTI